jgi:type IV pilus assembly protein PilC
MQFNYQASTKRGKIKTGLIFAGSEFEAKKALEAKNLLVINIKPIKTSRLNFFIIKRAREMNPPAGGFISERALISKGLIPFIFPWRLQALDLLVLTKNLSILIKSGLTLVESLETIAEQSTGRLKRLISNISERVKTGVSLATVLEEQKCFPPLYVNLIRSGESSGTLEENLNYLLDQLDNDYQMKKKLGLMMVYPLIVLSLSFIVGLGMAIFVLPKIATVFVGLKVELPLPTRILLAIADLFKNYSWQIVSGIFLTIIAVSVVLKQSFIKPLTHRLILSLPVIGIISRDLNLARAFRTLGTLLKSGLTIDRGLEIASKVAPNYLYQKALSEITPQIIKGQPLAKELELKEKLFPKMATKSLGAAEKSGSLESTLFFLARFYEQEVEGRLKSLSTWIEVGLLLIIGLVVLTLAVSILLPIYQITGEISKV